MTIFAIAKNKFAIGNYNQRATYVVKKAGKKFVGVRGQRPLLTKGRYEKAEATAELKAAFEVA